MNTTDMEEQEIIEDQKMTIDYLTEQINYLYDLIENTDNLKYIQHRLEHWFDSNSKWIYKPIEGGIKT